MNLSKEDFTDSYIKNFTTWLYHRQANLCISKFRKAKKKSTRDDYTYLLYTTYLQLVENFQIFLLVIFHPAWIDNIFITSSQEIWKRFNEIFQQFHDKSVFEKKHFFKLQLEKMIGCFCWSHFSEYHRLISEAFEDYTKHKHLLNSFKHWFRLHSRWEQTTYIWRSTMHKIMETDSSLVYYTKEWNTIYEISHAFSMEYIALKAEFIINTIENLKKLYFWNNKTTIIYSTPDSPKNTSKSTWKTPIFEVQPL